MNSKTIQSSLLFLFCLIFSLPGFSQKTTVDSPVFIAARLVDKLDEEDMANLCAYYTLAEEVKDGDFSVFKDKDGTVIRFKMNDSSPYVELILKESMASVKKKP